MMDERTSDLNKDLMRPWYNLIGESVPEGDIDTDEVNRVMLAARDKIALIQQPIADYAMALAKALTAWFEGLSPAMQNMMLLFIDDEGEDDEPLPGRAVSANGHGNGHYEEGES